MRRLRLIPWLLAPMLLIACAGEPKLRGEDLPDDFSFSVTVMPGQPDLEPAWYVLAPDGILRIALGERLPTSTFPPGVRTLTREQVRHVWELAFQARLAQDPSRTGVPDMQASAKGAAAVVYVAAVGRRKTFAVPRERAAGLVPIITELRRLGWVPSELPKPAPLPAP